MSSSRWPRHLCTLAVVLLLLVVSAGRATAWIPPLPTMAAKLDTQRLPTMNLRVECAEVVSANKPRKLMAIYATKDGRLMVRVSDMARGVSSESLWDRRPLATLKAKDTIPAWLEWWTGVTAKRLFNMLRLDRKTRSLSRDGRRIIWVAGARPSQPERAQVHLERATGKLRRVVEVQEDTRLVVDFAGHFQVEGSSNHWPRFVTLSEGGLVTRYEVQKLVEHAVLTDDDFRLSEDIFPEASK
jgi:hypothetical protein